jgi:hypothetical protein
MTLTDPVEFHLQKKLEIDKQRSQAIESEISGNSVKCLVV